MSAIELRSQQLEEDLGQCVHIEVEAALMTATVEYEEGHTMKWPDIMPDGVMTNEIMSISEKCSLGYAQGAAEPAVLATKSKVFSPVIFAGEVVAAAAPPPPLAVVGTVTARVSVLPVVGSELPTVLDAAVVNMEQSVIDIGNALDAVNESTGQSCAGAVLADSSSSLHDICSVISSWLRPQAVLTSQKRRKALTGDGWPCATA